MRKWPFILRVPTLLLVVVFTSPPAAGGDNGEIISISKREFVSRDLGRWGLDLLMEDKGRVFIVVSPEELAGLTADGVRFACETQRFAATGPDPVAPAGGLNGAYHTTSELAADLGALERDHPDLARVVEIGQSLEGRPILALKVSDNAALDEGEPALLFLGCHHAREWISVEVPFYFGKHLVESYAADPAVRDLVDRAEIWIVPLVNPDGLEYSIHVYRYWRKNRRANADGSFGVDINRNYGYRWGTDDQGSSPVPWSEVFRGTAPFSEPETRAVRDLFLNRGFRAMISFHSYSQVILYPWGYTSVAAPGSEELVSLAQTMSGLMAAVRGTAYGYEQAAGALGYTTNGDTADWTFGVSGAPSFTIELPPADIQDGGFFNDEQEIAAIFAENLPAMLYLSSYALDRTAPSPPLPRTRSRRQTAPPRTKILR